MKAYRFVVRVSVLSGLILLTGCGDKDTPAKTIQAVDTKPGVEQPATATAQRCENGSVPRVLTGECTGVWSVKKTNGVTNCEFEWKPRVTCPAGMTAVGLQSACYGVTVRPADANVKSSDECLAAHGKHPISPAYKLECCP